MAGDVAVSLLIYVLDTSYLIEIANCGRDSSPVASAEVRKRFAKAAADGGRFFVPMPCLFELGDHISDVKHAGQREKLVKWLLDTVNESLEKGRPWQITPSGKPEDVLPPLLERFQPLANRYQVGLVDAFTLEEAIRLKESYSKMKAKVHIWTNDRDLKSNEPDKEADRYLWRSDGTSRC